MLHDFRVAMVYWLERIFEIRNHIQENAFSLYAISKIMFKRLINCLEANARAFPIQSIKNNVQTTYKLPIS